MTSFTRSRSIIGMAISISLCTVFFVFSSNAQSDSLQSFDDVQAKLRQLENEPNLKLTIVENKHPAQGGENSVGNFTLKIVRKSKNKNKNNTVMQVDLDNIEMPKTDLGEWYKSFEPSAGKSLPKCGSIDGIALTQIDGSETWKTINEYKYSALDNFTITIPEGTIYDRASIPRLLQVFITKNSLRNVPPLIHDYLYRHGGVLKKSEVTQYRTFRRSEADKLFKEALIRCNVPSLKVDGAYAAVRLGGVYAWKGKNPEK